MFELIVVVLAPAIVFSELLLEHLDVFLVLLLFISDSLFELLMLECVLSLSSFFFLCKSALKSFLLDFIEVLELC
jgi:hypothetical protein